MLAARACVLTSGGDYRLWSRQGSGLVTAEAVVAAGLWAGDC